MPNKLISTFPFHKLIQVLSDRSFSYTDKLENDFATSIDYLCEAILINWIKVNCPNEAILSEESEASYTRDTDAYWVVDPLDGTFNYTLGLPYYGVQLARLENDKCTFALLWTPALNLISLWDGVNVSLFHLSHDHQLIPGHQINKTHRQVTASFGDFSKSNPSSNQFQGELMTACSQYFSKVRLHGSSCADFNLLIFGYTDTHILFSKRSWELLPGLAIANALGMRYECLNIDCSIYTGPCHVIAKPDHWDQVLDLVHRSIK